MGLVEASPAGELPAVFDQRNLSFAAATVNALTALGVMQQLRTPTGPIRRIHISRQGDFGRVRLEAQDYGRATFGQVVVARDFGHALEARLGDLQRLTRYRPATFVGLGDCADGRREVRIADASGAPVERPVVARAAGVRDEVVPAVYRAETRQVVDQPASTRMVDVPAVDQTLSWQVKVGEPREEKREVMCETNTAPDKIRQVQDALQSAGFSPGAIDGVLAPPTLAAVARYQQARGLPVHGYLDVETVRALGVAPN